MPATFVRRVLTGLLVAAPAAVAGDRTPPDLDLAHAARTALAADPQTARVHVLISVVDGGLVAGGPVPTDATVARIGQVLRGVPGVRHVSVSCWVPAGEADPLTAAVRAKLAQPTADPPANRLTAASTMAHRYAPPLPMLLDPAAPRAGGYSPRPSPAPPPPPGPPQYPTIRPPAVPENPGQDVASAVDEVRRADRRFAGLSAVAAGGTVTIAGRAADPGDIWELAAAVRRVPGVDRVIVRPGGR